MIIIHVMGGLGNQLYQYAMYEKLKSLGKKVKLDLYDYIQAKGEDKEWRALELQRFQGISYEVCTMEERTLFLDNNLGIGSKIRRKILGRKDRTIQENKTFMSEVFEMDNVYLNGFWNSEKYYEDIIDLLQKKIVFPCSCNEKNIQCINDVKRCNAVSIHIRRGDYLTVADGNRYMGICTDEYYKAAMNYIESKIDNPVYYIFSDDLEYAYAHFIKENMHVVDWNKDSDSLYDMQLMSMCKHNICANSTFSMWGARLNNYKDKIVIRPLKHDNYEDITPEKVKEEWKAWLLIDKDGVIF